MFATTQSIRLTRFCLGLAFVGLWLTILYGFITTDALFVTAAVVIVGNSALASVAGIRAFRKVECRPGLGNAFGALAISFVSLVLIPLLSMVDQAAQRMRSQSNLKQIALAFHNYESAYDHLPPAAICDRDGRPLLSWRVAILRFMDQEALYKEFHLDEPWDSPHNLALLPRNPYKCRSKSGWLYEHQFTYYRVFVGPGAGFEQKSLSLGSGDFPDGSSNTIAIIEAGEAVPWTKPDELEYHPDKPLPPLGGMFQVRNWLDSLQLKSDLTQAAFFDGSLRLFPRDYPEAKLRAMITRNGGEKIDFAHE